jgi:hypothetical protein
MTKVSLQSSDKTLACVGEIFLILDK